MLIFRFDSYKKRNCLSESIEICRIYHMYYFITRDSKQDLTSFIKLLLFGLPKLLNSTSSLSCYRCFRLFGKTIIEINFHKKIFFIRKIRYINHILLTIKKFYLPLNSRTRKPRG